MTWVEVLVGLAILLGIAGTIVPVLPGSLVVLVAVLVWAVVTGTPTAWLVFACVGLVIAVGQVVMYLVPGRRLKAAGIPARTLLVGGLLGVVGFFVVPVIGLFLGFVGGVYLMELARVGSAQAWPATVHALKAAGLSMLIELAATMVAASVWVVGVVAT